MANFEIEQKFRNHSPQEGEVFFFCLIGEAYFGEIGWDKAVDLRLVDNLFYVKTTQIADN